MWSKIRHFLGTAISFNLDIQETVAQPPYTISNFSTVGYDRFIRECAPYFPVLERDIQDWCFRLFFLAEVTSAFPLENAETGNTEIGRKRF